MAYDAEHVKNFPLNPRMVSWQSRRGSEERAKDKISHFLCGEPDRGLHGDQDQQLGAQRGRVGGVRALKRRAMAWELSGDHAQVNGRLSQHFLGFECEQNSPSRQGRQRGDPADRRLRRAAEPREIVIKNFPANPRMVL